jgi:hypothetical protein
MSRWLLPGALLGIVGTLSGCGSDSPDMMLLTAAEWKDDPGSVDEIGYWVSVDFGWPDRAQSCFDLPSGLHVTVNGREGTRNPSTNGDCLWDNLYLAGPFLTGETQPTVVRVLDGKKVLAEATYVGLLPGYPAQIAQPADGKVRLGESVVMSLVSPLPKGDTGYEYADYYWLDSPDGLPPYHDRAKASIAADQQSFTVKTPERTGRAALVGGPYFKDTIGAETCVGFTGCAGWPSATVGPVFVEVVP